jgi:hypothetical protein
MHRLACASLLAGVVSIGCHGREVGDAEAERATNLLAHRFPTVDVAPGGELNFICQSWTLHNDEPLYVNTVSMKGGPGWHHSNWLYAAEHEFAGPDGTWPCTERGFELVTAGISGGVFYTQSPEVQAEVQTLGAGAVVVIPRRAKIIAEIHLLNTSGATLHAAADLELGTLPEKEATVRLAPLALNNQALAVPPAAKSEFATACDFTGAARGDMGFRLYRVAPHYHALGRGMRIETFDRHGARRLVYETNNLIGEPLGYTLPEPLALDDATGLRFSCRYDNPGASTIHFGSGQRDEMCVLFGFTDAPSRFIGGVLPEAKLAAVQASGPDMKAFDAPCQVLALDAR